jgi:hypothetical protein
MADPAPLDHRDVHAPSGRNYAVGESTISAPTTAVASTPGGLGGG